MSRWESSTRVRGWMLLPALALLVFFVPLPAWIVDEFYSRDLYPWLQHGMTFVTNLVPLAVLDLLIALVVMFVAFRGVRLLGVVRRNGIVDAMWEMFRRLLRALAVVLLAFLSFWGCNYRRMPLETTLPGGRAASPTQESLQAIVVEANALAATLRAHVLADPELTYVAAADMLQEPMNAALRDLNRAPLSYAGAPKSSLILTPFFTWAGVNGMVNPMGLESIVHPDLLPFERSFVLAHEWAHLAGQADEAEASAVGWLACLKGTPQTAYSGSLYLIMEAGAALSGETRRTTLAQLDPGVRMDLDAIALRLQRQRPDVQQAASKVYDHYLRANRVSDGNRSYARALTLILAPPLRDAMARYKKSQKLEARSEK